MCERVHAQSLSHVQPFVTPWTIACQVPLSIPFPPPEDLPYPGIEPMSFESPAMAIIVSLILLRPVSMPVSFCQPYSVVYV